MYRVSWDMYKSVVRDIPSKTAGMFSERSDIDKAAKTAKTVLETLAKKLHVEYEQLIKAMVAKLS